jgi:hypothetical protein
MCVHNCVYEHENNKPKESRTKKNNVDNKKIEKNILKAVLKSKSILFSFGRLGD